MEEGRSRVIELASLASSSVTSRFTPMSLSRRFGHTYTDSHLLLPVLSQHIRLKRRPPPPPPSLLVRPPASTSTHNHTHAARRSIPILSATRPRSLLPTTTTISSLSSSGRYHLSHASISSSHLPPPPADTLPIPDSSPDPSVEPLPQAEPRPDSPPWQPAEELHIAPEALARFRAFREDYVRRNFRRGEGDDPEREIASLAGFGLGDEDDDEDDEDYGEEMDLSALLDESDGQDDEGMDELAPLDPVVANAVVVDDVDSYVPFSFLPLSSLPPFVPAFEGL